MDKLKLTATFPNGQTLNTFLNLPTTEQRVRDALSALNKELQWVKETQPQILSAPGKPDNVVSITATLPSGDHPHRTGFLFSQDSGESLKRLAADIWQHAEAVEA